MKTIVSGSPEFYNYPFVRDALDAHPEISVIVPASGRGVGRLAVRWANGHHIPLRQFRAATRSEELAQAVAYADQLIALWDGYDRKTKALIAAMQACGKQIYIVSPASVGWGRPHP